MQANRAGPTLMVKVWLCRIVGGCGTPAGGMFDGSTSIGSLKWWNDAETGSWSSRS